MKDVSNGSNCGHWRCCKMSSIRPGITTKAFAISFSNHIHIRSKISVSQPLFLSLPEKKPHTNKQIHNYLVGLFGSVVTNKWKMEITTREYSLTTSAEPACPHSIMLTINRIQSTICVFINVAARSTTVL